MSGIAGAYNIIADQGATFSRGMIKKDNQKRVVPLTGYTARMQVRSETTSSTEVLDLTTENSGIVIDANRGLITLQASAATMSSVPAGKYVYDLELISNLGVVERLVMGTFTVRAEVTR